MRCEPLSRLSDVIRKDRNLYYGSTCSLFAQAMLNQSRHVVYHSHYPRIFYSHRTNYTESADIIVRSHSIRRGDQRAVTHRTCQMLPTNYHVYIAGVSCGIVNAFVENLDQPRLLFEGLEQIAHALNINKVGLGQDV